MKVLTFIPYRFLHIWLYSEFQVYVYTVTQTCTVRASQFEIQLLVGL